MAMTPHGWQAGGDAPEITDVPEPDPGPEEPVPQPPQPEFPPQSPDDPEFPPADPEPPGPGPTDPEPPESPESPWETRGEASA
jgi:hypothetical protein